MSAAVDDTNKNLQGAATMSCDDTIDGGEGTEFDCTLKGKGGKSETVKIKIIKDGIAPVNRKQFESTLQKVAG